MNADGTGVVQLTNEGQNGSMAWSPDGSQIAFYSDREGDDIWVMNADGTDQRNLTGPLNRPISASFVPDWQPVCTLQGTSGDDVLTGTDGPDLICGRGGNDVVYGLGGDDVIFGGGGSDQIFGGSNKDVLVGGPGIDDLEGEGGDDLINAEDGLANDGLRGGPGMDTCLFDTGDASTSCP
jgi:Ca2+-binding RTX toxin-like protein